MKKAMILIGCVVLLTSHVQAQLVFNTVDINTGASNSTPWIVATLNGRMILSALYPGAGRELVLSDGTATGTTLLKDITPGTTSTSLFGKGTAVANNKLFFTADVTASGYELWITDGTNAGTQIIKDINPGTNDGLPLYGYLTSFNGKVYFAATDGVKGTELWVSDGTAAGTQMLKDINPGANNSSPTFFTEFNGKLYFAADDGTNGKELWVTDGTSPGTLMVKDINAGVASSYPAATKSYYNFTVLNNKMFFIAETTTEGEELWYTDGTNAGTMLLKDINPGTDDGINSFSFTADTSNGKLFFPAYDVVNGQELWYTDGTNAGTQMLKDIKTGNTSSLPKSIASVGNKVIFTADDGTTGAEPWISDGTAAGTVLLKDIFTGSTTSKADYYFAYKNHIYFTAQQINNDVQLWQSDGTAVGTKIVGPSLAPNANPLTNVSRFYLNPVDTAIYFIGNYDATGEELWSMKDTSIPPPPPNAVSTAHRNVPAFMLYPNPSDGNFKLQLVNTNFKNGSVIINDVLGKEIYRSSITNTQSPITLSNPPKGIYMVTLQLDDAISTQRITIE